jgi:hypothetical protein
MEKAKVNDNKLFISQKINSIIDEIDLIKKKLLLGQFNNSIRKGVYEGLELNILNDSKIEVGKGILAIKYGQNIIPIFNPCKLVIDVDHIKEYVIFKIDLSNNLRDFFAISEKQYQEIIKFNNKDEYVILGKIIWKKNKIDKIDSSYKEDVDLTIDLEWDES